MLDRVALRNILGGMGISLPSEVANPMLGEELGMDTLEIKRLRQLIEMRLGVLLPNAFRISRKDTIQDVIANVSSCCKSVQLQTA